MLSTIDLTAIQHKTPTLLEDQQDIGDQPAQQEMDGSLVQEEEKDTGVIKTHVYGAYWRAVGGCLATMVLLSLFFMQGKRFVSS